MKFGKNKRLKTDMDGRSRLSLNDSDEEEIDYHIFPGKGWKVYNSIFEINLIFDNFEAWFSQKKTENIGRSLCYG